MWPRNATGCSDFSDDLTARNVLTRLDIDFIEVVIHANQALSMVEKKRITVDIIGCPIVREANGLAMSSRNERLSKRMRNEAAFIYSTLKMAKSKFGTKSAQSVIDWVTNQFKHHKYLKLEYFEITDRKTLTPIRRKQKNKEYQAFIAVYADDVRLIDNIELN